LKMAVFWDAALCSLIEINRHFRGAYCLHRQGDLRVRLPSALRVSNVRGLQKFPELLK
jgi:hypothetical protein